MHVSHNLPKPVQIGQNYDGNWVITFVKDCPLFSHLVDGLLHLHQAQVWQCGFDEVHYGLQTVVLQDQRLVASQQTQGHLEYDLWALEEQHVWQRAMALEAAESIREMGQSPDVKAFSY